LPFPWLKWRKLHEISGERKALAQFVNSVNESYGTARCTVEVWQLFTVLVVRSVYLSGGVQGGAPPPSDAQHPLEENAGIVVSHI
jgi:hypothetical protein